MEKIDSINLTKYITHEMFAIFSLRKIESILWSVNESILKGLSILLLYFKLKIS